MKFDGAAPEITNARLAMLGFATSVSTELSTHQSILEQITSHPIKAALGVGLLMWGSLVPTFNDVGDEHYGPFTHKVELLNGRVAMVGFAALLALEVARGSGMFC